MYYEKYREEAKIVSKFSLIDLAGSERLSDKEKNPERTEEAKFINKSLSALGNVVAALRTTNQTAKPDKPPAARSKPGSFYSNGGSNARFRANSLIPNEPLPTKKRSAMVKHVPYRDSKLTHILKDSLGNNSFTHLIITLSPSYLCLPETISTLAFTKNAKAVK